MDKKNIRIFSSLSVKNRNRFLRTLNVDNKKAGKLYLFAKYLVSFADEADIDNININLPYLHNIVTTKETPYTENSRPVRRYNKSLQAALLDFLYQLHAETSDFAIERALNQLAAMQPYPLLKEEFEQFADQIEKKILASNYHDIRFYQQLSHLYRIRHEHPLANDFVGKDEIFAKLIGGDEQLFLAKTVKNWCEQLNLKKTLGRKENHLQQINSADFITNIKFSLYSSSYFYQKLAVLFNNIDNIQLAEQFLSELSNHIDQLRPVEASDISGLFFNLCNRLSLNLEGLQYEKLASEIACIRYEKKLLNYQSKVIKHHAFLNIVICGLRVRTVEWTKKFIEETQERLEDTTRELVLQIANTRICTAEKDYITAYNIICNLYEQEILNRDFGIGLLIRWTLVKSCYDLRNTDIDHYKLLENHTYTFRKWLYKQVEVENFPISRVKSFLNGGKYIKQLNKIDILNQIQKERFLIKIMKVEKLANRSWFIERLVEQPKTPKESSA